MASALPWILLLALLLRLPGLQESLWFDEVYHTHVYWDDPARRQLLLGWEDVHPPLFAYLLLGWTRLVGDSELAVRLPSLVSGLASVAVVWALGRAWLGPRQGTVAALLLALSPVHVWFSRESKANMLMLLLGALAVWLFWSAAETGRRRDWGLGSLVLLAGLYNHVYALPVGAALLMWLTWRAACDVRLRLPLALSVAFVGLSWLPLVVTKFFVRGESLDRWYLGDFGLRELTRLLFVWLPQGNTLASPLPVVLMAAVFLRGLWLQLRRARQGSWAARLLLLWLVTPLAITLAISAMVPHAYIERNMLVVLPPFVLLAASGAVEWWAQAGLVALTAIGLLVLLVLAPEAPTVYHLKPDWRAASRVLQGEVFVTVPTTELEYYRPPQPAVIHEVTSGQTLVEAWEAGWRPLAPFFLVRNTTWRGSWNEVWPHFARYFRLAGRWQFRGLEVYLFEAAEAGPATIRLDWGGERQKLLRLTGFYPGESASDGTFAWSRGPASSVEFPLAPGTGPYRLTVRGRAAALPLQVSLSLNGRELPALQFTKGGFESFAVTIPAGVLEAGKNALWLRYSSVVPLAPRDPRQSSVSWDWLEVGPWQP